MRKLAAIAVIGAILGIVADMAVVRDSNCGPAPPRSMCNNNLKQIVLGLHYYHDQYGAFPPAFIADSDGTPIHSWRVLILPFIGEEELYARYRFDEPWNGPNNSQLAASMPTVFRCPSCVDSSPLVVTNYLAVTAADAVFRGPTPVSADSISDSPTNTILVTETRKRMVNWMAPVDLPAEQAFADLQSGHGPHVSGVNAAFGDGAVLFLPETLTESEFRGMVSCDGGEP